MTSAFAILTGVFMTGFVAGAVFVRLLLVADGQEPDE